MSECQGCPGCGRVDAVGRLSDGMCRGCAADEHQAKAERVATEQRIAHLEQRILLLEAEVVRLAKLHFGAREL